MAYKQAQSLAINIAISAPLKPFFALKNGASRSEHITNIITRIQYMLELCVFVPETNALLYVWQTTCMHDVNFA